MVLVDTGDNTVEKRRDRVRKLGGNISSNTLSDANADIELNNADATLNNLTQKYDWSSSDTDWKVFIETSNYIAAASILDGNGDKESADKSKEYNIKIRANLKTLNRIAEGQNISTFVAKGINITDQLDPANYTQDATDTGSGVS